MTVEELQRVLARLDPEMQIWVDHEDGPFAVESARIAEFMFRPAPAVVALSGEPDDTGL